MAKVYFAPARAKKWNYGDSMPGKLEKLLEEMGLMNYFSPGEWVGVKTHFGSEGECRVPQRNGQRAVPARLTCCLSPGKISERG